MVLPCCGAICRHANRSSATAARCPRWPGNDVDDAACLRRHERSVTPLSTARCVSQENSRCADECALGTAVSTRQHGCRIADLGLSSDAFIDPRQVPIVTSAPAEERHSALCAEARSSKQMFGTVGLVPRSRHRGPPSRATRTARQHALRVIQECPRGGHWTCGRTLARASASLVAPVAAPLHSPFARRANRSAARAGTRAFRGINGALPTRAAHRFARAGPFHLFHGALAPALVRGAIGLARRKADAGQELLPRRLQRKGMNSHERLPRNWSRGGPNRERVAWAAQRTHSLPAALRSQAS